MELVNYDDAKQNKRVYGGTAGRKIGVTINDKNYILKFPSNLKDQNMKNVFLSYSNSPVCEYIGSHIYQEIGISVHNTYLGERGNKIVVACEDFLNRTDVLQEFGQIKVTYEPSFVDSNGNETNGNGTDLQETLLTIENHPLLENIKDEMKERFWDMFIIDALIGNGDRNNSNWGIILDADDNIRVAPVYDNGNSFNNKWDIERIAMVLNDEKALNAEACDARRCIYSLHGKKINPYHFIASCENKECNQAVKRLLPKIKNIDYEEIIDNISCIESIQKEFYKIMLKQRIEKIFIPAREKISDLDKMEKKTNSVLKNEKWFKNQKKQSIMQK